MPEMYCQVSSEWPFASRCTEYRKTGEQCMSDFECKITDFCWYADAESVKKDLENKTPMTSFKKCMTKYAAEDGTTFGWKQTDASKVSIEDFKRNGMFCKSGLAYNSK